jgi:hypothetical protein
MHCCSISKGHRNGATLKGDPINPRESRAAARQLFLHDPPPRLIYDSVHSSDRHENEQLSPPAAPLALAIKDQFLARQR